MHASQREERRINTPIKCSLLLVILYVVYNSVRPSVPSLTLAHERLMFSDGEGGLLPCGLKVAHTHTHI